MLPLVGYSDRLSARPGERIEFKISCSAQESYSARLVKVVCGDVNPDGPGIVERPVDAAFAGTFPARTQEVPIGSYARIDTGSALETLDSFTIAATIWPTTPDKPEQGIICSESGVSLAIGPLGASVTAWDARKTAQATVGKALRKRCWYRVWACWNAQTRTLSVGQAPLQASISADDSGDLSVDCDIKPSFGGALYFAALGGSPVTGHFNGKIEQPLISGTAFSTKEALRFAAGDLETDIVAAWDFSRETQTTRLVDTGPSHLHGELINLPARAMIGSNWTGEEMCWRHVPAQYGAIHFHDDDIYDCEWETDFGFDVPADMRSGVYAVRLEAGDATDMIPFFVPPPKGTTQAKTCVLIPTFTYTVYANHARGNTNEVYRERAAAWGAREDTPDDHPEYGLSTYNFHSDGSGICHASRRRPMFTMRSEYMSIPELPGSALRHFPADTHLLAWLDKMGHEFDVVTDDELHNEGTDVITPYSVVLTTSHPEYHTPQTLDALQGYIDNGGRFMYMGGNGFYWRVAFHNDCPDVIEVRRAEGGIRAWAADPGEYYHGFDGAYGGLWRRSGRPPQQLAGIGFSAQGLLEGSRYRRGPGADNPRAAWILEGIDNEVLGDFGLVGNGAAGYELDRADIKLGTPEHAITIASSEAHQDHFVLVPEEHLTHISTWSGEPMEELIRADIVFFEAPKGGAVFSTGSITFCGALLVNDCENNISKMIDNVVRRFLDDTPFEYRAS